MQKNFSGLSGLGIMGIQYACQNSFLALENAKISIFLALLRKVFLLLPFISVFPHLFVNQTMAVFLAEPVADTIAGVTTLTLFFRIYYDQLFSKKVQKIM